MIFEISKGSFTFEPFEVASALCLTFTSGRSELIGTWMVFLMPSVQGLCLMSPVPGERYLASVCPLGLYSSPAKLFNF
jgi:hypothetical protein